MKTIQGQLLIATRRLGDPNFNRTVVLMVRHDENGALGLVLNRHAQVTVQTAIKQVLQLDTPVEAFLGIGGPCEGPLTVMHCDSLIGGDEVIPGIFFTAESARIRQLFEADESDRAVRLFVGYSGWTGDQLETEIESGAWLLAPAKPEHIFETTEKTWPQVVAEVTLGREVNTRLIPDDPSVN